jgi:hypothetical protein
MTHIISSAPSCLTQYIVPRIYHLPCLRMLQYHVLSFMPYLRCGNDGPCVSWRYFNRVAGSDADSSAKVRKVSIRGGMSERTVGRVAGKCFSQQSTGVCRRFDCQVLFIIFILTTSTLRSRETPPLSLLLLVLLQWGGLAFRRTRLPGCGVLEAYAFGQSSGKYVTWRVFRAQYLFCTHSYASPHRASPRQPDSHQNRLC